MDEKKRGGFSGGIGFVLASAGSAVGLGNLWRFPYLAAKDGGGIFLLVYIIIAVTFGFAIMTTEIVIGRKTRQSPITAYAMLDKRFKFLGPVAALVPLIVFPYYCVIGGWVTKYAVEFVSGNGMHTITKAYFDGFISSYGEPIIWCLVFLLISAVVVHFGVEKGIEKFSKILMPVLCIIIVGISVFALTLKDPVSERTALEGFIIYITPDFADMTVGKFLRIVLDAICQIFFSMSLAMGIMITFGSYTKKETNLVKSVNQIEIFDTAIAFLAGLIIVPTVYAFQGRDGLQKAGPSLLFESLPKVFEEMGIAGNIMGALFFVLVLFAALTSSVSIMEAIVSMMMDKFKWNRKKATTGITLLSVVIAVVTCLGYNLFYFEATLPNGTNGQILDVLDYVTNYLLMPIIAIFTCVLAGWFYGVDKMTNEIKANGETFRRERLYKIMVRYIAPVSLVFILLSSFGLFD